MLHRVTSRTYAQCGVRSVHQQEWQNFLIVTCCWALQYLYLRRAAESCRRPSIVISVSRCAGLSIAGHLLESVHM